MAIEMSPVFFFFYLLEKPLLLLYKSIDTMYCADRYKARAGNVTFPRALQVDIILGRDLIITFALGIAVTPLPNILTVPEPHFM